MKSKWDRIKELYKNKYTKPLLFFGFYFIFFTVIILAFSLSSSTTNNNNVEEKDPLKNITNNYEYLYEIDNNNNIIILEGKHYGNKYLFTKKINNMTSDEVYIFYNDIYTKNNDEWVNNNEYVLVSDSFDNRLLDIDYLKSLINDAELINSTTNFDDSITDIYQFGNINIETISVNNELKKISLNLPLYKVTLQYKNINKVEDFVVEK